MFTINGIYNGYFNGYIKAMIGFDPVRHGSKSWTQPLPGASALGFGLSGAIVALYALYAGGAALVVDL